MVNMGRHKEWRKVAKRERRRRIRIKLAIEREKKSTTDTSTKEYQIWLKQHELMDIYESEEIQRQNEIEHEKWLKADKIGIAQWNELQAKLELTRLKRLEEEVRIQKEWENEQIRIQQAKQHLIIMEEKLKLKQELFNKKLEKFLSGDAHEPPEDIALCRETKPDMALCPFFMKTACCRFGDLCSRNHQYPGISKILLAANFYTHFGLENSNVTTEYGDDLMLEYEDSDTYRHFKEFFYDVLPEFQKYGEVVHFKVCHNYEKHLRGNTYVEFEHLRHAVAAYRGLHTRWYGGKQLSLQFCNITSWKNAICGLQISKRCPKGRTCNFLHIFKNPIILYKPRRARSSVSRNRERESSRSWRWSQSPEPDVKESNVSSKNDSRRHIRRDHSPKSKKHYSKSRRR